MSYFHPRNGRGRPRVSHHRTDQALADSIIRAIQQNDQSALLQLLKKRKRPPLPLPADERGWTVLHEAASKPEYKDSLELLLKYKDNILLDTYADLFLSNTPLHIAVENDCEESVELLLRNADPHQRKQACSTALWVAIRHNNVQIVKYLLNYAKNINQLRPVVWLAPLHDAAIHGCLEITRILLEKGADVRSKDRRDNLPLHLACRNYHFDLVRLLFESDPTTINCQNSAGITPFSFAARRCGEPNFDTKDLRFLLENGAKVEICDENGRTALHFAASSGNVEFLQLLLQFTDAGSFEKCLSNIPNILNRKHIIVSLACDAIRSQDIRCLEILLSSKISKSILVTPRINRLFGDRQLYSPLAYACDHIFDVKLFNPFLQLLLKHKITMLDDFLEKFQIEWPQGELVVNHPFSSFFDLGNFVLQPELIVELLYPNDVDIDYCLRCYRIVNSQPFATFSDYQRYYDPLYFIIFENNMKLLKLFMSTSVILEPDIVSVQYNPISMLRHYGRKNMLRGLDQRRELFRYLISLKPVYFTHFELRDHDDLTELPRFPYSTLEEEFADSTLQQLCRTVIRHHVRERTIEENLRNFKRKIIELPLPPLLKDYLLFKE